MKKIFPYLGAFMTLKKPDYLLGVVNQAVAYQARAMMFFLGSPLARKTITKKKLHPFDFHQALKRANLDLAHVCIHLPYLINLGNCQNDQVLENSLHLLTKNLELAQFLGIKRLILHPGSALKANRQASLSQVGKMLTKVLANFPQAEICLETMAGAGSQLGVTFAELKTIIDHCQYPDQVNVCFDLCHLYSAGYDIVNDWEKVLQEFDQLIGIKKLTVLHINDSLKPFASHLDRHANIGQGEIGFSTLQKIVWDPRLANKTMILETPYLDNKPYYKEEIALLLKQT